MAYSERYSTYFLIKAGVTTVKNTLVTPRNPMAPRHTPLIASRDLLHASFKP